MRTILAGALLVAGCGGDGKFRDGDVTWHQDIAPLLADRCGQCHVDGGIGPFSVQTLAAVEPWADAIVQSVESGRMPPFFAAQTDECDMQIGFKDDVRLTDAEKQSIADWVADDLPEGDPEEAVSAPMRAGSSLENPNVVLPFEQPFEVSGTQDIYQCFRVEVPNDTDVWITGAQVLPDNDLVVHHVLIWNDPLDNSADKVGPDGSYPCSGQPDVWPSELVGAWAPGSSPARPPVGTGTLFHPGATIVVNVHYHPTGTTTEFDQTAIALEWTTEQPPNHATFFLVDLPFGATTQAGPSDPDGPEFRIPAGASGHTETVSLYVPEDYVPWDLPVFSINPHMHYLGTDMKVTIRRDDAEDECLVHTPGFRFDFQTAYYYDTSTGQYPVIHPGDSVEVRCTYDNSSANPFLPQQLEASGNGAPQDVYWGEETGDEMCMAMVGLIIPPVDWMELLTF